MSLTNKRVLITRTRAQASELAAALAALGAEPILIPTIEIVLPASYAALDAALTQLATFDWLIFTSANAVEAFAQRFGEGSIQKKPRIAAIGPSTAKALEQINLKPNLIPPQAVAESLAESLLPHATNSRMLLIRAEQARDHLPEALRAAGADLTIAEAYRTVIPKESVTALRDLFAQNPPDAITFTSSSTAMNLFKLLEAANFTLPPKTVLASIGSITSETLRSLGHPPTLEAAEATIPALVSALANYFASLG